MNWSRSKKAAQLTIIFLITYTISFYLVSEEILSSSQMIVAKIVFGGDESNTQITLFGYNKSLLRNEEWEPLFGYNKSLLRNEEWEQLHAFTFIRREAAYYLVNQKTLTYLYMRLDTSAAWTDIDVILLVEYENKLYKIRNLKNVYFYQIQCHLTCLERYAYKNFSIFDEMQKRFNITLSTDTSLNKQRIKLGLLMYDPRRDLTTHYPIQVKIKEWTEGSRKGMVACSGSLNYGDSFHPYNYEKLRWWIELNKAFGYRQVSICTANLPDTPKYQELFKKHKDFINIYHLYTMPNFYIHDRNKSFLSDHNHTYFTNIQDIYNDDQYHSDFDVFTALIKNECFLDSMDKYEYAIVEDVDQLMIPHANKIFRRDSDSYKFLREMDLSDISTQSALIKQIEDKLGEGGACLGDASTSEKPIDLYMKDISKGTNINNGAIYMRMGHHLSESYLNSILDGMRTYFASEEYKKKREEYQKQNSSNSNMYAFKMNGSAVNKIFSYQIQMFGDEEVRYAHNLLKIHKLLFEDKNNTPSLASPYTTYNTFNRFFFLKNEWLSINWGNTIHHTDTNNPFDINFQTSSRDEIQIEKPLFLDYDLGHVSHFRNSLVWDINYVNSTENISSFMFDFNYMFCYYRKAFKLIASADFLPS